MKKFFIVLSFVFFVANVTAVFPSFLGKSFGFSVEANAKDKDKKKNKASKRKGPPAHAKAHGYRAKFKHYPDSDIYENTETGTFFKKDGKEWKPLEEIPTEVELGNGVTVDLESAVPELIRNLK